MHIFGGVRGRKERWEREEILPLAAVYPGEPLGNLGCSSVAEFCQAFVLSLFGIYETVDVNGQWEVFCGW